MKNLQNRREFLKGSAWMGVAAVKDGCSELTLGPDDVMLLELKESEK